MKREKSVFAVLGFAAAMAFAIPAGAQGMQGFYVGGSFGSATAKDACTGLSGSGISCDDTDTAWRILGGYQINRNFAAELGYHNLGTAKASGFGVSVEIESKAWELVGIVAYPVVDKFSVYGKFGFYRGETKATSNTGFSASDTNTDFTFGLGAQYDVTRQLGVRGEYQKYNDVGGDNVGKSDVGSGGGPGSGPPGGSPPTGRGTGTPTG